MSALSVSVELCSSTGFGVAALASYPTAEPRSGVLSPLSAAQSPRTRLCYRPHHTRNLTHTLFAAVHSVLCTPSTVSCSPRLGGPALSRSTSCAQCWGPTRRTRSWRSTSAGRWTGWPGWSRRSRRCTCALGAPPPAHGAASEQSLDVWQAEEQCSRTTAHLDLHAGWGPAGDLLLHPAADHECETAAWAAAGSSAQ